MPHSLTDQGKI